MTKEQKRESITEFNTRMAVAILTGFLGLVCLTAAAIIITLLGKGVLAVYQVLEQGHWGSPFN